jgi:hypothetical protein
MTGAEKSDDELLLMYLNDAEKAIINRLYPMEDMDCTLPDVFEGRMIEIAAYLYNKRGAEGEISHNENGISRTYESGSIPESMLSDIIPFASVII